MKGIGCGALVALTVTTARAEEDKNSAGYMLPYCKISPLQVQKSSPYDAYLHGQCYGVVSAMRNMLPLVKALDRDKLVPFCADIPAGSVMIELVGVVIRYGNMHPELTHIDFQGFVLEAFHQKWPCKD
jgi:hypothetical protein